MKTLNNEQIKQISKQIIENELKKYNIYCSVLPMTTLEYYANCIFNRNFRGNIFKSLINCKAIHYEKKLEDNKMNEDLVILISNLQDNKDINKTIFELIRLCYNETRHSIQKNFDNNSYEGFINKVDNALSYFDPISYEYYPERFSFEIGANLYSIGMTKNYLKQKYPKIYTEKKQDIDNLEGKYRFNYKIYNAPNQINTLITIANNNRIKINNISPVFNIFINDDNSFKGFKDIIVSPEYQALDKRISNAILSSSAYLKKIDMGTLSNDELTLLQEILQYTSTIYNNQITLLINAAQKKYINSQQYIIIQIELKNNIEDINKYIKLIEQIKQQKKLVNKIG